MSVYSFYDPDIILTLVDKAGFTRYNVTDKLGRINQFDCVAEFHLYLHVSTMLKQPVNCNLLKPKTYIMYQQF